MAASGLLLIKGVMDAANYPVDLGKMALYSLPGGIVCLILAGIQFMRFDTWAKKEVDKTKGCLLYTSLCPAARFPIPMAIDT